MGKTVVQLYFQKGDELDHARLFGTPEAVARLQAEVDELAARSRRALAEERVTIQDVAGLFKDAFEPVAP